MISVTKGQFKNMIGTIVQEIQPEVFLIQFANNTTGIVIAKNIQEVISDELGK